MSFVPCLTLGFTVLVKPEGDLTVFSEWDQLYEAQILATSLAIHTQILSTMIHPSQITFMPVRDQIRLLWFTNLLPQDQRSPAWQLSGDFSVRLLLPFSILQSFHWVGEQFHMYFCSRTDCFDCVGIGGAIEVGLDLARAAAVWHLVYTIPQISRPPFTPKYS